MKRVLCIVMYSFLKKSEGGIESWLQKFLSYHKHILCIYNTIIVIGLESDGRDLIQEDITNVNIHFYLINISYNNSLKKIYHFIKSVKKIIEGYDDYRIDMMCVGVLYPSLPVLFVRKTRKIIWLRTFFEYEISLSQKLKKLKPFVLVIEKICLDKTSLIIANGFDTKKLYETKYPDLKKKIYVIPNAVRTDLIHVNSSPLSHERIKIAFVGRFFINKGIISFLDSIEKFNLLYKDNVIDFIFIGFGKYLDAIEKMASIYTNVVYIGRLNNCDVLKRLAHIDATVHLTFQNKEMVSGGGAGISNSLLESIYADNLVIAWRNPIYAQILTDENAFLIPEGNVDSLINVYTILMENRKFGMQKIKYASDLKIKYDFENHIKCFCKIIS